MAFGTMASRILGLIRDAVTAAVFDRTVTDAWLVAYRLPNLFRRMLGEGSLSISFIPVFVDLITPNRSLKDNSEARRLIDGVFTLLLCFLTILTALGIVYSDWILSYMVPGVGYMSVPGKFELTVHMAKIMFGFIFLVSLYAYFMAILNSFKRFTASAFAPTLFNAAMIASAYFPDRTIWPGESLAWGVMLGGVLQMAFLIPSLIAEKAFPKLTFHLWSPHIKRVLGSLLPSWIGVGILQLTGLVNVRFASELAEGTHSWIYLADRVLELPLALFAVSLGSALLPTLSGYWARGQKEEMVATSTHYLKLTIFLALPAAVGVYVLSTPIVQALFDHGGRFSPQDTHMTSSILKVYSFAILTYGGVRVIVSPFYAIKNTWLPAIVSSICLVTHYIVASHFVHIFGAEGLAASTVVSSGLNLSLLIFFHTRLIGPIRFFHFGLSLTKYLAAAAFMGFVLQIYVPIHAQLRVIHGGQILSLSIVVVLGIISYFVAARILRVEELEEVVATVKQKIARKLMKKT